MRGRVARALALALAVAIPAGPALAGREIPPCVIADDHHPYDGTTWASILMDTRWRVASDYAPVDLVDVSDAGISGDGKVRRFVIADLAKLATAAKAAGNPLAVLSSYRSYKVQERTFRAWVRRMGMERALKVSARPGHSEHQLGTTIDFKSKGGAAPWEVRNWGSRAAGKWLANNAWRFGFVMSYPQGSSATSCYSFEPWHYRYVGREAAEAIQSGGLVPRVWLITQPKPTPTASPTPTPTPTPTATSNASAGPAQ